MPKYLYTFFQKSKALFLHSLLVSNGADINSGNDSGSTPLIYATKNGDFEIVKLLLESGADIIKLLIEKQK